MVIIEIQESTNITRMISFMEYSIHTTVTNMASVVDSWIAEIEFIHRSRLRFLVVGLDIEWRPNNRYYINPVATIQLCVGQRCLVFQIIHSPEIPSSLVRFLSNTAYTFVGVGIQDDVEKLAEDYRLDVRGIVVDLRNLAASQLCNNELLKAGLRTLVLHVLGRDMVKPKWISRSNWDSYDLSEEQIRYASLDAFFSFQLGVRLGASSPH